MKSWFLNRTFQAKPYHLLWDSFLLYMTVSPFFMFQSQQRYGFGPALIALVVIVGFFGGLFAWRRAWIQRAIQGHFQREQQAEFDVRRQLSEQKQVQSSTERFTAGNPKLGLIDAPLSQQAHASERGTNSKLGLIDQPLPRNGTQPTTTQQPQAQYTQPVKAAAPVDVDDDFYNAYSIIVPLSHKWSSSQATAFLRSLLSRAGGAVQLSVVGQDQGVFWEVVHFIRNDNEKPLKLSLVKEIVEAHYPDAIVQRSKRDFSETKFRQYKILGADYQIWFDQGKTADEITSRDPLTDVIRVMRNLKPGEEMRYSITIFDVNPPDQKTVNDMIFVNAREVYEPSTNFTPGTTWSALAGNIAGAAIGRATQEIMLRGQKVLRFSEKETQLHLQKLTQPLVICCVSVEMDSPNKDRLSTLENVVGAVEQLTSGYKLRLSNQKAYTSPVLPIEHEGDHIFKSPYDYFIGLIPDTPNAIDGTVQFTLHFTVDELGAIWHLPSQLMESVSEVIKRPSVLPEELLDPDPNTSVILGTAEGRSVGIQLRDLNLHAFVGGMQGQGKSTLLLHLAQQLIAGGHGVAILDPHRSLINEVIATSIDDEAAKHTVLLEAEDREYPIPLNPMRATPGMDRDSLFSSLMWIVKAIYAKSWSEGQMERMFRNILQVVLTDPEATPLDIQKIIDDPNYRRRALAATKASMGRVPRSLNDFWSSFEGASESGQRERTAPVLNRLGLFLDGPVELMMSHPFGLDFREIINNKKVLLFDLGGEKMLSEADNLGSIFFAMLFFHAFAPGPIKEGEPARYHVIIDETHRFVKAPIQMMFSEARKYGLSLILADQWLGQLPDETREGIINNKGTTISFRVAPNQARDTARILEPYVTADDLVKQGRGEAAIQTIHKAQTMPAFQMKTLPPLPKKYDVEARRAAAKTNLASVMFSPDPQMQPKLLSVAEIDAWLDQRYSGGAFSRDLQADSAYQDTVIVDDDEPVTEDTAVSFEDKYSDVDEGE